MPTLRIDQHPGSAANRYRIEVAAEGVPNSQPQSLSLEIAFELSPQERERIRWYLEDFLQFDEDPAPQIAKRVEALMRDRGEDLYHAIFEGSVPAIRLWAGVQPYLSSTRIEVTTGIAEATAIPWELLRDPNTGTNLALSAEAFVRTQRGAQAALLTQQSEAEKVRILLVICRPRGGEDVPFRSVAGRLVTRLSDAAREAFELEVLRPPTYEHLATKLRLAHETGHPYHIVHFDGHGTYADPNNLPDGAKVLSNLKLDGGKVGPRGFLLFEDPDSQTRSEFVDGSRLGALLRDSSVPLLVLNACQSAFAEPPADPEQAMAKEAREEVEAYGSLAQAVVETGATGVVAMRYSVYVVTAAQFIAELYGALARGRSLGEATSWARKNLADEPERKIAFEARPLHDWSVPVVWERTPLRLWPEKPEAAPFRIKLDEDAASKPGALDSSLPARPDVGFFGRDETLYALDRAFDTHKVVLLHAYAGSGKTATAAEFARWYALTGGIKGPVLFSSFERHLPLARVLDKIGAVFGPALQGAGVQWDAITETAARRDVALQVLQHFPVLWIWDNVEPVTGFPAGTESAWSAEEQQELRAFLAAARDTKAKFLLTSRRDEQAWLGELPRRVRVPPMPMQERLQLAGAIIEHRNKRLVDLPDIKPLLRFTQGNPLTILVTVGEALRAGIDTKEKLEAFVAGLGSGEASFEDEVSEGRTKSLGASLAYGFGHAFSEDERKILALLHLFQGFVDVDALRAMGAPEADWCLEAVRGLSREQGIAILDRAAEVGLLTAHGGGYYTIHPALPWYFRDLFDQDYPVASGAAQRARRAFVAAMGKLGNYYHDQYVDGNRDVLGALAAEEDNLLAAWRLARHHEWWSSVVMGTMQGLRILYDTTGRRAAQRRLVEAVVPDFVDPTTDGPLPGREEVWGIVTDYRVSLARQERRWQDAERLQRAHVDWSRERATPALATAPETLDDAKLHAIRTLAVCLHELGQIQRERGDAACVEGYREAFDLARAIRDMALQAVIAFNLGHLFKDIPELRDLDEAEHWYKRSLELRTTGDVPGKGRSHGSLGSVAYERFIEARAARRPGEDLAQHLAKAAQYYEEALGLIPETEITDRGVTHQALGTIYGDGGDIDRALHHYQQDIRYCETAGDIYGAGVTRKSAAITLFDAGWLDEAHLYAEAALANFSTFGDRAAADIEMTQRLIAAIDEAKTQGSSTP